MQSHDRNREMLLGGQPRRCLRRNRRGRLPPLPPAVFFLLAAIFGHGGYVDGEVTSGSLVLTLIGFGFLTLGGWLGGTVVFVHGMRVLNLVEEPAMRAAAPVVTPEKEEAAAE
jgi:hypothetical protein